MSPRRDRHLLLPAPLRPLTRALGKRYRRLQHAIRNLGASPHPRPIFVLGNQKAGTSAIAALLARACGLSGSIDMLMEVDRPLFQRVHAGELAFERYLRRNRWEFSHAVVKEPNLTFLYPQLVRAFPTSPVVFVVRDPRDNLRSLLGSLGLPGDAAALDPGAWSRLSRGWRLVLDSRWLGIPGDHYIEQLAGRWLRCVQIYRENADAMLRCRYEDFHGDKLGELRRLADALGLPVVADVSAHLDEPFQPSGGRETGWREFFGNNLARIESICGDEMAALGYR